MTSWHSKTTLQRLLDLAGLHYTTSERSGPFWQSMLHNFLSRPLSFLDWTTAMLFWLDYHHAQSNPLQMIQNAAAWLVFSEPKRAHVTPLFSTGSRLQLASSLRHWCLHIEHPPNSTHLWQSTSPLELWDLWVNNASWCHHRESQKHFPERFHSPFLAGGMDFLPQSGMLNPWQFSSNTWKLISSVITFARNNSWNFVLQALPVSVCLFIMYRLLCSSIVSRFG